MFLRKECIKKILYLKQEIYLHQYYLQMKCLKTLKNTGRLHSTHTICSFIAVVFVSFFHFLFVVRCGCCFVYQKKTTTSTHTQKIQKKQQKLNRPGALKNLKFIFFRLFRFNFDLQETFK